MNKAQLIEALTGRLQGDRRAASAAVEGVVDIVVRTVESGENVTITGFGVFEKRARAARVARNPRTGETVRVAPTSVPAFRPGAQFKDVVSGAVELPADAPAVKRAASTARTAPTRRAPAAKTTAAKTTAAKTTAAKTTAAKTTAAKTTAAKTTAAKSGPKTAAAKSAAAQAKVDKPAKSGSKADKASKASKPSEKKKSGKPKK